MRASLLLVTFGSYTEVHSVVVGLIKSEKVGDEFVGWVIISIALTVFALALFN